jgi:cation transport ATPase
MEMSSLRQHDGPARHAGEGDAPDLGLRPVSGTGTIYTCPMHPEVRQDHPGNSRKCGMALEPLVPELTDEQSPELIDFTHRFWWTLPFSLMVMVLAMAGHAMRWFAPQTRNWIEFALALPVALWAGWLFYVRDAAAIENLRRIDTLIVDKTGTPTEGRPVFEKAVAVTGFTDNEVLRLAASLDQGSEHPLAAAIVAAAHEQGLALGEPAQFDSQSGIGVRGNVEGKTLAMGNTAMMEQLGVQVDALTAQAEELRGQGASVMHLAIAMGTGTDVVMNSAQLTLVKGDLRGIAVARALSDATVANMRQNLAFAFVYNALGVPLAAGLLFPLTGWLLSPMIAALAMSLSSASVIGSALRLRRASLDPR